MKKIFLIGLLAVLFFTPSVLALTWTRGNEYFNVLYCQLTGCTMSGNIAMGSNDITGADDINATEFYQNGNHVLDTGDYFNNLTWTFGNDWNYISSDSWYFNDSMLSTTYYNATQSSFVAGTLDAGTLADIGHTDGAYDSVTLNFSEAAGSPGLDLRINFTSITAFSGGVMRYKTSSLVGIYPIIQLWNYDTSAWEDYPSVASSTSFATIEQPVFDYSEHISGGVVQMRIYKASTGNINNHYYVDWVAIFKGYGTPAGEETDPYSVYRDGTRALSGNWDAGDYNITANGFNLGDDEMCVMGADEDAYSFFNTTSGCFEIHGPTTVLQLC